MSGHGAVPWPDPGMYHEPWMGQGGDRDGGEGGRAYPAPQVGPHEVPPLQYMPPPRGYGQWYPPPGPAYDASFDRPPFLPEFPMPPHMMPPPPHYPPYEYHGHVRMGHPFPPPSFMQPPYPYE